MDILFWQENFSKKPSNNLEMLGEVGLHNGHRLWWWTKLDHPIRPSECLQPQSDLDGAENICHLAALPLCSFVDPSLPLLDPSLGGPSAGGLCRVLLSSTMCQFWSLTLRRQFDYLCVLFSLCAIALFTRVERCFSQQIRPYPNSQNLGMCCLI